MRQVFKGFIGAAGLIGLGTLAWGQAGQGILTTLSSSYLVPIQTTGALNNATSLATLQTWILGGGGGTPTAIVATSITGGDSSLGIAGQAATSASGAGGAVATVGGIGGATSGAGGAVSSTGGAATAGNSAGGASSIVGGAGSGNAAGGATAITGGAGGATGAGGAVGITSGAGGSTSGAAGAVNIAVGTAIAANGASVTIAAGDGAGSTNAGGDVNLVPGDAVSTGTPGLLKVNGDANLVCATLHDGAGVTDTTLFIATRPLYVTSISAIYSALTGGAATAGITKETGTTAPGAGTTVMSGTFNLNTTINTVQNATLVATVATKTLAAGDRLGVDFTGSAGTLADLTITACMSPL